jgi:hypothetical protein
VLSKKSDHGDEEPVFQRMEKHSTSKLYMENILSQIKSEMEVADCTFAPRINKVSKAETERRGKYGPVYERLQGEADRVRRSIEVKKVMVEAEKLKDATFKPTIPAATAKIVRRKGSFNVNETVHNRLYKIHTTSTAASMYGAQDCIPPSPPGHVLSAEEW